MFIIWGSRQSRKIMGERNERCGICGNNLVGYIKITTWFTLFFIPLFPYSFKYMKVCGSCGATYYPNKAQFMAELEGQAPPANGADNVFATQQTTPQAEEAEHELRMREIAITREKRFAGSGASMNCYIDQSMVAEIKNGKTLTMRVDNRQKNLFLVMNTPAGTLRSNVITLPPNSQNRSYIACFKNQSITITEENISTSDNE